MVHTHINVICHMVPAVFTISIAMICDILSKHDTDVYNKNLSTHMLLSQPHVFPAKFSLRFPTSSSPCLRQQSERAVTHHWGFDWLVQWTHHGWFNPSADLSTSLVNFIHSESPWLQYIILHDGKTVLWQKLKIHILEEKSCLKTNPGEELSISMPSFRVSEMLFRVLKQLTFQHPDKSFTWVCCYPWKAEGNWEVMRIRIGAISRLDTSKLYSFVCFVVLPWKQLQVNSRLQNIVIISICIPISVGL